MNDSDQIVPLAQGAKDPSKGGCEYSLVSTRGFGSRVKRRDGIENLLIDAIE